MKPRRLALAFALTSSWIVATAAVHAASVPVRSDALRPEVHFKDLVSLPTIGKATFSGRAWGVQVQSTQQGVRKTYAVPYYPVAEFELFVNCIPALAAKINDVSAGVMQTVSTMVRVPSLVTGTKEWTVLGDSRISYFEFPALDASVDRELTSFRLGVIPTSYIPMDSPPPGGFGPVAGSSPKVYTYSYSVSIPQMDCSKITAVSAIRIQGVSGQSQSSTRSDLAAPSGADRTTNPNFTLDAVGASAQGLRDWMIANQNAPPTYREIFIQLNPVPPGPPVYILHGTGVGLASCSEVEVPTREGVRACRAELFVERWEVQLPGPPKARADLALPTGLTGGRK